MDAETIYDNYVALRDRVRELRSSLTLPSGERVHRHQLVSDEDDERFLVTDIEADRVKLTKLFPPTEISDVGFGRSYWLTPAELDEHGELQTTGTTGRGHPEPVWGY